MAFSDTEIRNALTPLFDPTTKKPLLESGLVSAIVVNEQGSTVILEIPPAQVSMAESLRQSIENALRHITGGVRVLTTAHRTEPPRAEASPKNTRQQPIPNVRAIIAVASGKGGVGKSTTAVNLALALKEQGLAVGVMDADIYGPSVPRLLNLSGRPESGDNNTIIPLVAHGMPVMSMGFLVPPDAALVWRGPMVMGAVRQMLREVVWGTLDVLVVDMPPGTGDAQLTLAQEVPLSGAVIVCTPQDLALIDAARSITMFQKVSVPLLGLIENMSGFCCPHCGETTPIFSHGGGQREAARLEIPFLGAIPLDMQIRQTSDDGTPLMVSAPTSPHAQAYRAIAQTLIKTIFPVGFHAA